eukprot:TRINITY_DN3412_c0_g1_i1.p1 TRINITY_DN3412_c0_g1~~TRINITY_DN3412_c0_g1_i1.p1  ORF type:complete len:541 (-),score=77.04 TRINITY_DN3412_c0_g1_i1:28-1650(-)
MKPATSTGRAALGQRALVEPTEKSAADEVLKETWETLGLAPIVIKALQTIFFFSHATAIQLEAIPAFRRPGNHVVVEASTGSGKTLAFLLPIVEKMLSYRDATVAEIGRPRLGRDVHALVLAPTAPLARQTWAVCQQLCHFVDPQFKVFLFTGSKLAASRELADRRGDWEEYEAEDKKKNAKKRKRQPAVKTGKVDDRGRYSRSTAWWGNIVVATPDGVEDLLDWMADEETDSDGPRPKFATGHSIQLVVDEADVFLDGYRPLLDRLMHGHTDWEVGLFGATATSSKHTASFVDAHLRGSNQSSVTEIVAEDSTLISLRNWCMWVPTNEWKISLLVHLLTKHSKRKHFVFFNTPEEAVAVGRLLSRLGPNEANMCPAFTQYFVHDNMPVETRGKQLHDFLDDNQGLLLCTDSEIAFGIDISRVEYVIHYAIPSDPRLYLHRVGRTARMGMRGTSILLLPDGQQQQLAPLLETLKEKLTMEDHRIPVLTDLRPIIRRLFESEPELLVALLSAEVGSPERDLPAKKPRLLAHYQGTLEVLEK